MNNKTTHHVCPSCGWGSTTIVCKRCGAEYTPPVAVKVEKAEEATNEPSKKDDMTWFVF